MKSGAPFTSTTWLDLVSQKMPQDIITRANKDGSPFPSPSTIDVPLIMSSSTDGARGMGLARAFGERPSDGGQNVARDRMLSLCRFNAELLLAKIALTILRGEDQTLWARRIEVSIQLNTIWTVFAPLGMPRRVAEGPRKQQQVIDWIMQAGASYDCNAFRRRIHDGHPSLHSYLDHAMVRGVPNMHIQVENGWRILIDGKAASAKEVLERLQPRLQLFRQRLLFFRRKSYMEMVLCCTSPRSLLAVIAAAITPRCREKAIKYDAKSHKADQLCKMLVRYVLWPGRPINVPKTELQTKRHQLVEPWPVPFSRSGMVARLIIDCMSRGRSKSAGEQNYSAVSA